MSDRSMPLQMKHQRVQAYVTAQAKRDGNMSSAKPSLPRTPIIIPARLIAARLDRERAPWCHGFSWSGKTWVDGAFSLRTLSQLRQLRQVRQKPRGPQAPQATSPPGTVKRYITDASPCTGSLVATASPTPVRARATGQKPWACVFSAK